MSHDLIQTRVANLGSFTINAPNTIAFAPGTKIRAKRAILAYTTGNTTLANIVTVQRRPLAGVAANQVSLFSFPTTVATNPGDIDFADLGNPSLASSVASDGSTVFVADDENYPVIWPGQDIAFVTGGEGTAGVCAVYLEYEELPFVQPEVDLGIGALNVKKLTITSL